MVRIEADMLPYSDAIERQVLGETAEYAHDGRDGVLLGAADDKNFVTLSLHWSTTKKKKVHGRIEELPTLKNFH